MELIPEVILLKRLNVVMKSHGVDSKEFTCALKSLEQYVTHQAHPSNQNKA
jgi:hypothetical protein